MRFVDFVGLLGICLIWAVNAVLSRYAIADEGLPPLILTATRFLVAGLCLCGLLLPLPRPFLPVLFVALLMGAGHFGFLMIGYGLMDASAVTVLLQAGLPTATLLSALILSERIGALRLAGSFLSLTGVIIVLWRPDAQVSLVGAVSVLLSASSLALGSVLMKRLPGIKPLQFQAFTSLSATIPLAVISLFSETGFYSAVGTKWQLFAGTALFGAVLVTIVSHTGYYRLLRSYEVSLIVPLSLLFPLMTVGLGIAFLGERPDMRFLLGAGLVLVGVVAIASTAPRRISSVST
ncbi:hypothetical protein LMIY3S_00148 [Labrys miyagiensis]